MIQLKTAHRVQPSDGYEAWALRPAELAARGQGASGLGAFAALQRPWLWSDSGPQLSSRAQRALASVGFTVPRYDAHCSADGATKLLFTLGTDRVETVHMPRADRVTLCVSSQVGCAMGCGFCATAHMGFKRHLSAGEIVAQVLTAVRAYGPRHPGQLTLVFMGMGEPLHNLHNVLRALEVLCDPRGMGVSERRVTVSTSGLVPQIDALGQATPRPLLAVSLNATTDELRTQLMPIGQKYPLAELAAALRRFPVRARERIMLEYVLLRDINDSDDDARRLANFGAGFSHHINIIPFNEHPLAPYRAPSEARVDAFAKAVLAQRSTLLTVRRSRARDVQGACGQLVTSLRRTEFQSARAKQYP